jgi:hypothetical protein
VTKNERWIVEKLSPDRYGAHPQAPTAGFVQNNVQILQQLTDEQIMRLAGASDKKVLDTTATIDYDENVSGDGCSLDMSSLNSPKLRIPPATADDKPLPDIHDAAPGPSSPHINPSFEKAGGYDLSAFGDLT